MTLDFTDLAAPPATPRPGGVTVVACPGCRAALRYRPFDRTYFTTAADAAANRRPIRRHPKCGRALLRRNLTH